MSAEITTALLVGSLAESWVDAVVGGGLVWCDGIGHEIAATPE